MKMSKLILSIVKYKFWITRINFNYIVYYIIINILSLVLLVTIKKLKLSMMILEINLTNRKIGDSYAGDINNIIETQLIASSLTLCYITFDILPFNKSVK